MWPTKKEAANRKAWCTVAPLECILLYDCRYVIIIIFECLFSKILCFIELYVNKPRVVVEIGIQTNMQESYVRKLYIAYIQAFLVTEAGYNSTLCPLSDLVGNQSGLMLHTSFAASGS